MRQRKENFDPRPEWYGYDHHTDWEIFRGRYHYTNWWWNSAPFEQDPNKRPIGGGYNKQGVRFTVNANGEVKPEGCGFRTGEDDDKKTPVISIQKVPPSERAHISQGWKEITLGDASPIQDIIQVLI